MLVLIYSNMHHMYIIVICYYHDVTILIDK
jgi:hypothetical protein